MNALDSLTLGVLLIGLLVFAVNTVSVITKVGGARKWLKDRPIKQLGTHNLSLPLNESVIDKILIHKQKVLEVYGVGYVCFVAIGSSYNGKYSVRHVVFETDTSDNGKRVLLSDSDLTAIGKQYFKSSGLVKIERLLIQRSETETSPAIASPYC